jgi:hypothetical protein
MKCARLILVAALAVLLIHPALAENKLPVPQVQEVLIKTSLLTLNDADLTGNFTVLHARLSKPFREQVSPERLRVMFKDFADKKTNWNLIAALRPVPTKAAIDKRGVLLLDGYFDTKPIRLRYELAFIPSENEWKPVKIFVRLEQVK